MENIAYKTARRIYKNLQRITGKTTRIGNFRLKLDPENSQPYVMKRYPEHGTGLVRLARAVTEKYPDTPIIDIGANFGDTTAMLLSDKPDYKIICIEGDAEAFELLRKNFGSNPSVSMLNVFLSDRRKAVSTSFDKMGGSLRIDHEKDRPLDKKIEFVTFDSLLEKNKEIGRSKLFKVDTDGYDLRIMKGAEGYLTNTRPVIFFEYDNIYLSKAGENPTDIFGYLRGFNYKTMALYDNFGRFLLSLSTSDEKTLAQLDRYISNRTGAYQYYDIAAFHEDDGDLAADFINSEENRK